MSQRVRSALQKPGQQPLSIPPTSSTSAARRPCCTSLPGRLRDLAHPADLADLAYIGFRTTSYLEGSPAERRTAGGNVGWGTGRSGLQGCIMHSRLWADSGKLVVRFNVQSGFERAMPARPHTADVPALRKPLLLATTQLHAAVKNRGKQWRGTWLLCRLRGSHLVTTASYAS